MIADINLLGHQSFKNVKLIRINKLGMDFIEIVSPVYKESSREDIESEENGVKYILTKVTSKLMDTKVDGLFSYNSIYSITNIRQCEGFSPEIVVEDDDLPF